MVFQRPKNWPEALAVWKRIGLALACAAIMLRFSLSGLWMRLPDSLVPPVTSETREELSDRNGVPLSLTKTNRWNVYDQVPLSKMPPRLVEAALMAEDRRFFAHRGTDWLAAVKALQQNFVAGRVVRGGSTITHQVVRMLHPRARTVWSRILEVLDAHRLESRFSKLEILEFYLNQVPLAGNTRGVANAAKTLFGRSLDTLTIDESISLVLSIRNPSLYHPCRGHVRARAAHAVLRARLDDGVRPDNDSEPGEVSCRSDSLPVEASHFLAFARHFRPSTDTRVPVRLRTTLDAGLQLATERILRQRLRDLAERDVGDGALLAVEPQTGEILAWVSLSRERDGRTNKAIDAVTALRQPGSTLKPFLYAMAFERGMSPGTEILDFPLSRAVGTGIHAFRNFSGRFYGAVSMAEALGNSLNTPAVRLIQLVGVEAFLERLRKLGFDQLTKPAFEYGEGIALGVGEVSLFQLVRAYTSFVRRDAALRPLSAFPASEFQTDSAVTNPVVVRAAKLVRSVLEDPAARRIEFGDQGILDFPIRTAVKTGTSTDYRDAWAVGANDRAVIGVWLGNLDATPMKDVTGAEGAAVVVRSAFAEVEKRWDTGELRTPLRPPPKLDREPDAPEGVARGGVRRPNRTSGQPLIQFPTPGLRIALDPRIPDSLERMEFELKPDPLFKGATVRWFIDGRLLGVATEGNRSIDWFPQRGRHVVHALVAIDGHGAEFRTPEVGFEVR
jgi:penicillin-binding protein 1C